MNYSFIVAVAAVWLVGIVLQGCGGGGSTTTTTTAGSPTPAPGPSTGWNLPPISVQGQHLYFPNGSQFHVQGIGFPDLEVAGDESINDWIDVLKRINSYSSKINAVRIYRPPKCSLNLGSTCFEPFMREADRLGIYVLIAGSGVVWGTFPNKYGPGCTGCDKLSPPLADGMQCCYQKGGVLGFGRTIFNNFYYPNTLGIVLANEIEQNMKALPALKAYARDMKIWMQECNENDESPSKGQIRQIPLMYAATDADVFQEQAGYLFCESSDVSIDIYGLNVERWCGQPPSQQDSLGKVQYDQINQKVKDAAWNGAFLHSEEGGPEDDGSHYGPRTWGQLPEFANKWPYINGYFGYAYYGNVQYNMFDGTSATAKEYPDGTTFFNQVEKTGAYPPSIAAKPVPSQTCASYVTEKQGHTKVPMASYSDVKIYATGDSGYAKNCPKIPSANPPSDASTLV